MRSILLIIGLLIPTVGFCQKSYKPILQKDQSCVIIKDQRFSIQDFKLNTPPSKKDNGNKNVATIGIIGFGAIISVNYWSGTSANLKTEKAGYIGLMTALAASLVVVRIAL